MRNDELTGTADGRAPKGQWHRKQSALAFLAVVVVGVVFGLPSLSEPFGVDQGIYGYIAERLLEGAVDHRDVFDQKPPGIHTAYALTFAVFGHNMWSIRLLDLLVVIATGWCLYAVGRLWSGERVGLLCAVLYVACYESFFTWVSRAQPETWVNLALVAAFALLTGARGWVHRLGAGLALGFGFWFKPTIVLPGLLCLALLARGVVGKDERRWRHLELQALTVSVGAVTFSLLVLLYYAANASLRDLFEVVFAFNLRHHAGPTLLRWWEKPGDVLGFIFQPLWAVTIAALMGMAMARRQEMRWPVGLAVAWLALAFVTIVWQGSFAAAHYVLVLTPLVYLASLGLNGAIEKILSFRQADAAKRRAWLALTTTGFGLIALNLFTLSANRWGLFIALSSGRMARDKYYSAFKFAKPTCTFQDLCDVGAYLQKRTSAEQTVYVWGFRPIVAYLARRRMPTRFIFRYPLTRTGDPRWWEQFLSDLHKTPPAYFLVALDDGETLWHPESSRDALEENAALRLFLRGCYELDRIMDGFEIYRLRQ